MNAWAKETKYRRSLNGDTLALVTFDGTHWRAWVWSLGTLLARYNSADDAIACADSAIKVGDIEREKTELNARAQALRSAPR